MRKILFLLLSTLLMGTTAIAQEYEVKGTVTGAEDKEPLPGVSIVVKGTTRGIITDIDGNYSLQVPAGSTLQFSFIGFQNREVVINSTQNLNIGLKPDVLMLDEFVAVGYGSMKKSDLTGSVTSVSAEKLKQSPASGIDQALQGRAAGVTVNANSGQPGAQATVRIRGIGTINNSDPIYVVDGVILDNISFLSPGDIAATEVLKDASATAIYGSRGANGVILVTTRKGSTTGDARITFDGYMGVQNRWRKIDLMNAREFATAKALANNSDELMKTNFNQWIETWFTGRRSPYFPAIKTDANPDGYDYSLNDTDWQDEVFESNAKIQNYYLSAEGGNKTTQYAMSATYFQQDGTIMGSWFERLTLRVNTSHQLKKWIKVGENLTFMSSGGRNAMNNSASAGASILSAAIAMAPWDPTHYPDNTISYRANSMGYPNGRDLGNQIAASTNFKNVVNPFSMVENSNPEDKTQRWVGDIYVELTPVKGLTLRSDVSMDLSNGHSRLYKPQYLISAFDQSTENFLSHSLNRYQTLIYENTLTYQTQIAQKHDITLLLGTTTQEYNYYSLGGSGSNFPNATPENWYLLKVPTENRTPAGDAVDRSRMTSFLGRLHYVYANKYMATMNFRADGSSKFPKEKLWGYFPSVALGWKVSEEPFFENLRGNVDFLRLRLGWGRIGNEKIGSGAFNYSVFTSGPTFVDYVLGTTPALATGATVLTYPKVGKWEETEQYNAGLDFGLWQGRLSGTVDLFVKDTRDMLLTIKGPAHVGNRYDAMDNAGEVRNEGIEISLDHRNKIGAFDISVGGNVSFIRNEITAMNGGDPVWREGYAGDNLILCDAGYAINTFWGYEFDGVFSKIEDVQNHTNSQGVVIQPNTAAGDARYRDLNDDGVIDDNDKTDIGNPFPWLTYGFNASVNFRNFDLQLFFQGVYGNEIYNALRYRTEGKGDEATWSTAMNNAWRADNIYSNIPNPFGNTNNYRASSRFVENGAYLRLKNMQLGYTLPKTVTDRMGIGKWRFYLSGSNLLTWTDYSGYDPEVGSGVDYGNYPQARTLMVGTNINF
ncbi:MAG: TonB-dependent receptor [Marinilabiliaceae bacterium]|nr:TonB-dependent receptor [Marinilabiliaceae bacterium]